MRQLKDYSTADNIKYLKQEHKLIYECIKEMAFNATSKFIQHRDKIDEQDDFELLLATLKNTLPQGLAYKLRNARLVNELGEEGNLKPLANIFESILLDRLDRYEFNSLDPEIQDLYLKAQKEIDK